MNSLRFLSFLLITSLFVTSCGKDDSNDDEPTLPDNCQLTDVSLEIDESTRLGLFDVTYNDDGSIATAGLQDYIFSYDTEGNVVQGLLESGDFNPQVKFLFTYENGKIIKIQELWGDDANLEERHVFTPTYAGNFVDKLMRTGLGGDQELDYDFDSNGNPLTWTNPTFRDYREYTFDTASKGLFENLTHNQAFAYGITISQPHFHFTNAVTGQIYYNTDGSVESSSTFTDTDTNVLDFQTKAGDPDNDTYYFEYKCQ